MGTENILVIARLFSGRYPTCIPPQIGDWLIERLENIQKADTGIGEGGQECLFRLRLSPAVKAGREEKIQSAPSGELSVKRGEIRGLKAKFSEARKPTSRSLPSPLAPRSHQARSSFE